MCSLSLCTMQFIEQFNCTDKCPEDIPHKVTETVNGLAETICTVEPIIFE